MSKDKKILALNGYRGIFAIMIFLLHYTVLYLEENIFTTCYLFCEGFFVLSGFLLANSLNKPDVSAYEVAVRKVRRLYPEYLFSLLVLCILWMMIPAMDRFYLIDLTALFAEASMLNFAGLFKFHIINGVSWFLSSLFIAELALICLYKLFNDKLKYLLPFLAAASYSIIFVNVGILDCHGQRWGFLYLGLIRALGGVSCGMLVYNIKNKLDLEKISDRMINIIEVCCVAVTLFITVGRQKSDMDFIMIIVFSLLILCASLERGVISKFVSTKPFQLIGNISYEIYLFQVIVIYLFTIYGYDSDLREHKIAATLIAFGILAVVSYGINYAFKRVDLKSFIKTEYAKYAIPIIVLTLEFIAQGTNVWAEVVAEYMPYAYGMSFQGSFGGYLTIFPVLLAKAYYYISKLIPINYFTYMNIMAYLYALLCLIAIIKVLSKSSPHKFVCVMIAFFAVLSHPSVQSIINITHLGYIPLILFIIECGASGDVNNAIVKVPKIIYIPLILAIISKPSLFFILLFFVLIFTKIYKNKAADAILSITAILSVVQSFLFSSASSGLAIGGVKGIIKAGLTFVQSVGASILFAVLNVETNIGYTKLIIPSFLIGAFIIFTICIMLLSGRNKESFVRSFILFISLGCANLPYLMIDYNAGFKGILTANIQNCFINYKLQYQITSVVVGIMILIQCIDYWFKTAEKLSERKAEAKTDTLADTTPEASSEIKSATKFGGYRTVINTVLSILLINGFLSGAYNASDITVQGIDNEIIHYDESSTYMYCPLPDWTYTCLDSSLVGFMKGEAIPKYLLKPEAKGGGFRDINPNWNGDYIHSAPRSLIYIMLSDNAAHMPYTPIWMDKLILSNRARYVYINNETAVQFSATSINGIRYAVMPYSEELLNTLMRDDTIITIDGNEADISRFNYVIM